MPVLVALVHGRAQPKQRAHLHRLTLARKFREQVQRRSVGERVLRPVRRIFGADRAAEQALEAPRPQIEDPNDVAKPDSAGRCVRPQGNGEFAHTRASIHDGSSRDHLCTARGLLIKWQRDGKAIMLDEGGARRVEAVQPAAQVRREANDLARS